jgi:hypothetical protein
VDHLAREEIPEWECEHDRGHEQGLDDRQATVRKSHRLERVPDEERDCAEEPPRLFREVQERARRTEGDLPNPERSPLLQRRCEREEEGRDESKDLGHDA